MLKTQRWDNIFSTLARDESISVESVMELNNVSRSTARRDLKEMEEAKLLQRVRGGALSMPYSKETCSFAENTVTPNSLSVNTPDLSNDAEPVFRIRQKLFQDEKKRIAQAAHDLVRPNETLMLGGGTTILEFSKTLYDINPLYIATNDLYSALTMADYSNIDLTVLGGSQRQHHYAMNGYFTEQMISQMHADKAFIGIDAVDFDTGYMNFSSAEIRTNKLMMAASKQVIILADHSKFEKVAFVSICKLEDVDLLITDKGISPEHLAKLKAMGINVMTV